MDSRGLPARRTAADALRLLPRRTRGYASPADWRDEVVYLLMVDRFSDGLESTRSLLDRDDLQSARPDPWTVERWAESGHSRFQGGTLKGVISKLDYLHELGVTTIWLGPPWKQRPERNDYHGYAIQDFLDVDPRFGTKSDLVDLVAQAHLREMRVIFDVMINHTGENWVYQSQVTVPGSPSPGYRPADQGPYAFGAWLSGDGTPLPAGAAPMLADDGVWPAGTLQSPDAYHRAGFGSYGGGDGAERSSAFAEFRWADWYNRDLALPGGPLGGAVLQALIDCWTYWLELTDCDGFRIDTFKHVRVEEGRWFCAAIREYAEAMGKDNFLLVAEVAGGDSLAESYLTITGRNLTAVLELGEMREKLRAVAAGTEAPAAFFSLWPRVNPTPPSALSEALPPAGSLDTSAIGSQRNLGNAFVYSLDDHDNVGLEELRFATRHPSLTVPAAALVLLTLGVPCLYYGTELALGLPPDLVDHLPHVNDFQAGGDRYLREAMFGPAFPRRSGRDGLPTAADPLDHSLPGFGPFGTCGQHVFDPEHPTYRRISALNAVRAGEGALRRGRQYLRDIRTDPSGDFGTPAAGGLVAWSRILARTEVLCVANLDPEHAHGADITVDSAINPESTAGFRVLLDTGALDRFGATSNTGSPAAAATASGRRYVTVGSLGPAEVMVLRSTP